MSAENTTQLVLALLGFALVAARARLDAAPAARSGRRSPLAAAGRGRGRRGGGRRRSPAGRVATTVLVALAGLLAVVGGGPITTRVFAFVDSSERAAAAPDDESLDRAGGAGEVLRGGAWIGALERLAVFAGLAAGFPEGVAVVLALKGVGRFPELRHDQGRRRRHRAVHHRHLHQRALGRRLRRDRASPRCPAAASRPPVDLAVASRSTASRPGTPTGRRPRGSRACRRPRPATVAHLVEGDRRRCGPSPRRCRAARRGPARPCRAATSASRSPRGRAPVPRAAGPCRGPAPPR